MATMMMKKPEQTQARRQVQAQNSSSPMQIEEEKESTRVVSDLERL
jgi:hypothetical protein